MMFLRARISAVEESMRKYRMEEGKKELWEND